MHATHDTQYHNSYVTQRRACHSGSRARARAHPRQASSRRPALVPPQEFAIVFDATIAGERKLVAVPCTRRGGEKLLLGRDRRY